MFVGLWGFLNIIGYFIDDFVKFDQEFKCYDDISLYFIMKIVQGYFLMFFIILMEIRRCIEDVMVKNDVFVCVCGYLYMVFGYCFYKYYKYVMFFKQIDEVDYVFLFVLFSVVCLRYVYDLFVEYDKQFYVIYLWKYQWCMMCLLSV